MKRFLAASLCLLQINSAAAFTHGIAPSGAATGATLQGIQMSSGYPYLNQFKTARSWDWGALGPSAAFNNGYPANTANLTNSLTHVFTVDATYAGSYHIGWASGTGAIFVQIGGTNLQYSASCGTVVAQGSTASSITLAGTPTAGGCDVTFTPTGTLASPVAGSFPSGFAYTNMTGAYLVQDRSGGAGTYNTFALYQAGEIFNPTFLDWILTLNPKILRGMDAFSTNNSNMSNVNYQPSFTDAFTYSTSGNLYASGAWGGTATGTGKTGDPWVFTYPDVPGSWTDGETFQFLLPNTIAQGSVSGAVDDGTGKIKLTVSNQASFPTGTVTTVQSVGGVTAANAQWTVTNNGDGTLTLQGSTFSGAYTSGGTAIPAPTVNVGGRGAKILIGSSGGPFTTNSTLTAGTGITAVYNSTLNQVVSWNPSQFGGSPGGPRFGGMVWGMPYQVWVALCNKLNKDCWFNIPTLFTDASVTTMAAYVAANLKPSLNAYWEWVNEVWNPGLGFQQTALSGAIGTALGYPIIGGNNQSQVNAYYGKRVLEISALTKTAWQSVGRSLTTWRPVLAHQGAPAAATDSQRFQGQLLGTRIPITGMSVAGSTVTITATGAWTNGETVYVGGQTSSNAGGTSLYPDIVGFGGVTQATVTNGSPDLTNVPAVTGIYAGQLVSGTGVQGNSKILSVTGSGPFTITMDKNATASNSGVTINTNGLVVGSGLAKAQNPAYVVQTGGTGSFTISQPAISGFSVSGVYVSGGAVWRAPVSPNRPADQVKYLSYAPYNVGAQMAGPADAQYGTSGSRFYAYAGANNLLGQAYNYVNGNPTQQAAALAWADNDLRKGTVDYNVSAVNFPTTPTVFTENTAASFSSAFGAPYYITAGSGGVLPGGFAANTIYYGLSPSSTNLSIGTYISNNLTAKNASDAGTFPYSLSWIGGFNDQTLINLSTAYTGQSDWYTYWANYAIQYTNLNGAGGLLIGSYEGGYQGWAATGAEMSTLGSTYNPPSSYGGNVTITSISAANDTITVSGGHNLVSGNAVTFTGSNLAAGLLQNTVYYVIAANLTSTVFSVSLTQGGSIVNITSAGSGTQSYSQDAGNVLALFNAYKASSAFAQAVQDQLSQQMAVSPAGSFPAWYGDVGSNGSCPSSTAYAGATPSPWGLSACDQYGTNYKSYDGIQIYNSTHTVNWLLERDINPASNDNAPVGLEKAA